MSSIMGYSEYCPYCRDTVGTVKVCDEHAESTELAVLRKQLAEARRGITTLLESLRKVTESDDPYDTAWAELKQAAKRGGKGGEG